MNSALITEPGASSFQCILDHGLKPKHHEDFSLRCKGKSCIAWRWMVGWLKDGESAIKVSAEEWHKASCFDKLGYCGMCGKPDME